MADDDIKPDADESAEEVEAVAAETTGEGDQGAGDAPTKQPDAAAAEQLAEEAQATAEADAAADGDSAEGADAAARNFESAQVHPHGAVKLDHPNKFAAPGF